MIVRDLRFPCLCGDEVGDVLEAVGGDERAVHALGPRRVLGHTVTTVLVQCCERSQQPESVPCKTASLPWLPCGTYMRDAEWHGRRQHPPQPPGTLWQNWKAYTQWRQSFSV